MQPIAAGVIEVPSIQIQPQNVVQSLTRVEIVNTQIDLYKSATFRVFLKSEDSTLTSGIISS